LGRLVPGGFTFVRFYQEFIMSTVATVATVLDAACSYANFKLSKAILNRSINAKLALGLPVTAELEDLKSSFSYYAGPRLVAGFRIYGWFEHELDDCDPDDSTAPTEDSCTVELPIPGPLSAIQSTISAATVQRDWNSYWAKKSRLDFTYRGTPDSATKIVLLDFCSTPVAIGRVIDETVVWEPFVEMSAAEIEAAKRQIIKLRNESAFESGWDNFSTAAGLSKCANELRDAIDLSRARAQLVV